MCIRDRFKSIRNRKFKKKNLSQANTMAADILCLRYKKETLIGNEIGKPRKRMLD